MPTRNSLSLISLGTPTSMGPASACLKPLEELIAGNGPLGHSLWLLTFLSVISSLRVAAAPYGPCESARIHKGRRMSSIGRLKALSFATAAVLALGSADAGTLDKV